MDIESVYDQFPCEDDCIAHLEQLRWDGHPICPYCASTRFTSLPEEKRYHCNSCNTTYSVTVKTIFHHTHLPLQKWFLAINLILNNKEEISVRQMALDLHINRNTAWYLTKRIRKAMTNSPEARNLLQALSM